jgi:hypothetical protein
LTSTRRFSFASKSKVPPQLRGPLRQVLELVGEGVEAFGFHAGRIIRTYFAFRHSRRVR